MSIPVTLALSILAIFLAIQSDFIESASDNNNSPERQDWVTQAPHEIHPITPEWKEWDDKWKGKRSGMVFNYLHYPRVAHVGDALSGEFACSYHYIGGTPEVFISLYTEWDPDSEIRLYHGVVGGDSSLVLPVEFRCPDRPGLYKIRVFYATAFGPVPSFYGAPPPSLVTAPGSGHFMEMRLEVLKKD